MGIRDVISITLASKLAIHSALGAASNSNDPYEPLQAQPIRFEIESAWAEESLPKMLTQVEVPVVYILNEIAGIRLNAVTGEYSPAEALLQLTANTGLTVVRDERSGAWLVKRQTPQTTANHGSNNHINSIEPKMPNTKTTPKKRLARATQGLLALLAASNVADSKAQDDEDENVFELSPFSVTAQQDSGYRASSTLAGTRLNTDLKNVGSAISVLTKEFFDDTGATDAASALSYALGAEVSGPQGNFAGNSFTSTGNSVNTNSTRVNPQGAQRIRGLASAELTRGYFLTDIPFDGYNTGRVTINRGPNSLLFGIGSPGGVINNSVNGASTGDTFGELGLRFSHRGSHRATIDYNKVLLEEKLAVRFSALSEEMEFKQKPAFEEDERVFFAFESVLAQNEQSSFLGRTTLRGNFETGSITRNPPEVIPPGDGLKDWFSVPNPAIQDIVGIDWATTPGVDWAVDGSFQPKWTVDTDRPEGFPGVWRTDVVNGSARPTYFVGLGIQFGPDGNVGVGLPSAPEIDGVQSRIPYSTGEYGRVGPTPRIDLFLTKPFEGESFSPGFKVPVIMNRNVFDNQNQHLYGNTSLIEEDFDAYNLTLEQVLLEGNAGIEIAFDEQRFDRDWQTPLGGNRGYSIRIDVNENFGYNDVANPNVGRPVIASGWGDLGQSETDRSAMRATAFYQLDFAEKSESLDWLGRHVFTGFYSEQKIDRLGRSHLGRFEGVDFDNFDAITGKKINNWQNGINFWQYLGPSYLDDASVTSASDIRITNVANLPQFEEGLEYTVGYFDRHDRTHKTGTVATRRILDGGSMSQDNIDSNVFSIQSYLFNDNLVGLAGWREDSIDSYEMASNTRLPSGEFDPANFALGDTVTHASGNTFTWSLVAHLPAELPGNSSLSFHYNESENFAPSGIRRNTLGEVLSPPEGATTEYGFTLNMLEDKFVVRTNWFETKSSNAQDTTLNSAANNSLISQSRWLNAFSDAEAEGLTIQEAMALGGNPPEAANLFSSYQEFYDAIIGTYPQELADRANWRYDGSTWITDPLPGRIATTNFVAKGFEIDAVAMPTQNWRLGFNIAKQETVQSDTAAVLSEVVNTVKDRLIDLGVWDLTDTPLTPGWTFNTRYTRDTILPTAAALTKNGQVSPEQRKWRVNAFTNYEFNDGRFDGFAIGGALRWQDKVATGFPLSLNEEGLQVPDLSRPFMGSDELAGDVWMSYKRPLNDKIDWKVQLNVRNLIGEDDYIPVFTNPDGSLAVVRNPNPTELFLQNTFSF